MACSDVGCSRSFLAVCLFLSTSCGARAERVDPPALPKAAEPPVRAAEPVAPKPPPITPTVPRWVVYDEHDEGVMCLTTRPPTPIQSAAFQAMRPDPHLAVKKNQSLFAIVDANRCVSSSCSRNKKHTCKVELAGSELRVTSKAHYEVHEGGALHGGLLARERVLPHAEAQAGHVHGAPRRQELFDHRAGQPDAGVHALTRLHL